MSTFDKLKQEAYEANMLLPKYKIVYFTWGNVSVYSTEDNALAIKPSGVAYEVLKPEDIVVVGMSGEVIEGDLQPSSDLLTHIELYKNFADVRAVVHTHSAWACGWAQAGKDLPCLGTTHADCFYGSVPCTRALEDTEIQGEYERETGRVIVETFETRALDPLAVPGVLVKHHGPFTWAQSARKAVENAATLEIIAHMNAVTLLANPQPQPVNRTLLDKHYYRKHGAHAYYGQKTQSES